MISALFIETNQAKSPVIEHAYPIKFNGLHMDIFLTNKKTMFIQLIGYKCLPKNSIKNKDNFKLSI